MLEAMPIIRAQVSIPATSTVTEDTVTNTWHFSAVDKTEGTINAIQTALLAVYEAFDASKADTYTWTAARLKWYDLADPEERVPFEDELLGATSAGTGDPLPQEVAMCLSFNGEYVSGFSQARRRGRVYLGPLAVSTLDTATGRFSNAFTDAIAAAGAALLLASTTASDWAWVVYSPTGGTSYPVVAGWADNAPDIQRRRGLKASRRTTFG
jgi:hypothetical protein